MQECDNLSQNGELWSVLTSAGLWISTPCSDVTTGSCRSKISPNEKEPKEKKTYMIGTQYSGTNSGEDKSLRLITFVGSEHGPVNSEGVQSFFFNNLFNNKIKWRVKPVAQNTKLKNFRIAFYTPSYITRPLNPNTMLPMITTKGPAFYVGQKCGSFEVINFVSFYVVTNANVSVELWATYKKSKVIPPTCLTELFVLEDIIVCNNFVATEQLVSYTTSTQPSQKLIRPIDKYLKLSRNMINYLVDRKVIISIFGDNTDTQKLIFPSRNKLENTLDVIFIFSLVSFIPSRFELFYSSSVLTLGETDNLPPYDGKAYSFKQGTLENFRVSFDIKITGSSDAYKSNFTIFFDTYVQKNIKDLGFESFTSQPSGIEIYVDKIFNISADNIVLSLSETRTPFQGDESTATITNFKVTPFEV